MMTPLRPGRAIAQRLLVDPLLALPPEDNAGERKPAPVLPDSPAGTPAQSRSEAPAPQPGLVKREVLLAATARLLQGDEPPEADEDPSPRQPVTRTLPSPERPAAPLPPSPAQTPKPGAAPPPPAVRLHSDATPAPDEPPDVRLPVKRADAAVTQLPDKLPRQPAEEALPQTGKVTAPPADEQEPPAGRTPPEGQNQAPALPAPLRAKTRRPPPQTVAPEGEKTTKTRLPPGAEAQAPLRKEQHEPRPKEWLDLVEHLQETEARREAPREKARALRPEERAEANEKRSGDYYPFPPAPLQETPPSAASLFHLPLIAALAVIAVIIIWLVLN